MRLSPGISTTMSLGIFFFVSDFGFRVSDVQKVSPEWFLRNRNPNIGFSLIALALPLLVAGVLANHADHVFALHDAAGFAKPFD